MKKKIILLSVFMLIFFNGFATTSLKTKLTINNSKIKNLESTSNSKAKFFLYNDDFENSLIDIEYSLYTENNSKNNKNSLDLARIKLVQNNIEIIFGKTRLGWGQGFNFNPIDIFNETPAGSAFDSNYEKEARNSITFTSYLQNDDSLEFVYAGNYNNNSISKDIEYGIRYKQFIFNTDFEFIYAKRGKELKPYETLIPSDIYGASIKTTIPYINYGYWIEGNYSAADNIYTFITGIDNYFWENYYFNIEYYQNGYGKSDKNFYDNNDLNKINYNIPIGTDYLIPSFKYEMNELFSTTFFSFININDRSFTIGNSSDYYYNDLISFNLTEFFFNGEKNSEYYLTKSTYGDYGISFTITADF
ncbi:hypothetical protein EV215_0973 [Hypnocyclicus thermotrophus]|uniref:Uncharacterized protein n=1 Tax=Hypnocyclicus thermotrophus TaxID=1627895 RepID=A0AA46I628_9FUSO|nr:hypothetical protein [Hypnocyclicus thermotrophus]TDT71595.1 hypothetical protein EV215_0973 [Hypnocyclicus thermotrophus]